VYAAEYGNGPSRGPTNGGGMQVAYCRCHAAAGIIARRNYVNTMGGVVRIVYDDRGQSNLRERVTRREQYEQDAK